MVLALVIVAIVMAALAFALSAWNVYTRSHEDKENVRKLTEVVLEQHATIKEIDGGYMQFLDELRQHVGMPPREQAG